MSTLVVIREQENNNATLSQITTSHLPPAFIALQSPFLWPKAGIFLHDSTDVPVAGVTGPGWWLLQLLGKSTCHVTTRPHRPFSIVRCPSSRASSPSITFLSPFSAGALLPSTCFGLHRTWGHNRLDCTHLVVIIVFAFLLGSTSFILNLGECGFSPPSLSGQ